MPKTLYDKLWDMHVVRNNEDGSSLIYIDRHMLHEVTSPQAFEGLHLAGRKPWRTSSCVATEDHSIPTKGIEAGIVGIEDAVARLQVETLEKNTAEHQIINFDLGHPRQGIVHVVGPEGGYILPGMTVVCGDSHTSTNGAFGTISHGIGTSEVEHVLATQTLVQRKMKNMQIKVEGDLQPGVSAKDVILYIIGEIGTAGATGCAIEYTGSAIRSLSMEGRMTVCNMSIEAGAKTGIIAPDEKTYEYLRKTSFVPEQWEQCMAEWKNLYSDNDAHWDYIVELDAADILPQVTWGTSPEMVIDINGCVPNPTELTDKSEAVVENVKQALRYMDIEPKTAAVNMAVDYVFIGSCTNSRIEDLRDAASIVEGKKISEKIDCALVVPGSGLVKQQAESEGLDKIFTDAGFEWRYPGCSMCLGMNNDQLPEGKRCASTSNRNFEGRQGAGGRTHLVSPQMAAAAALHGHFVDVRALLD